MGPPCSGRGQAALRCRSVRGVAGPIRHLGPPPLRAQRGSWTHTAGRTARQEYPLVRFRTRRGGGLAGRRARWAEGSVGGGLGGRRARRAEGSVGGGFGGLRARRAEGSA